MANRSFTPFPILTSERLTLRQLSTADQQNIFALRSDAEINKYLDRAPSQTIQDAVNFINSINGHIQNNNAIYWVITLNSTEAVVGTICLFNFSQEKNSCEIGYELLPKFQHQGIMKEALAEVIAYAFQTLQFQKIVAFTHKANLPSTQLLMKFNFLQSLDTNQEPTDYVMFYLSK